MKDLLISVANRTKHEKEHGPTKLRKTLEMLYSTCTNRDNFDIQVVICSDQLKEYQPVLNDYPECLWAITTYKFGQFMEPLFVEPTKYIACREIIIAQVMKLLSERGIDRHVACEMNYQGCVDDTTASKMLEKLDMFNTLEKDLEPIVNSIYEYCKQ